MEKTKHSTVKTSGDARLQLADHDYLNRTALGMATEMFRGFVSNLQQQQQQQQQQQLLLTQQAAITGPIVARTTENKAASSTETASSARAAPAIPAVATQATQMMEAEATGDGPANNVLSSRSVLGKRKTRKPRARALSPSD